MQRVWNKMEDNSVLDGKYMQRRKYYIPKNEVARYYGLVGDTKAYNFILECDYDED